MRIGDVAARAGVSPRALRYYEEQGLLGPERTGSGQRVYPESAVARVRLIQTFFAAGLSSRVVAQLLPCVDTGEGSEAAVALLHAERDRITAAVADLMAARDALDRVIALSDGHDPQQCTAAHLGREPQQPETLAASAT